MRLIIMSTENGEMEEVMFTNDLDTPAEDFLHSDLTVDYDENIRADLPSAFPLDYPLRRQ